MKKTILYTIIIIAFVSIGTYAALQYLAHRSIRQGLNDAAASIPGLESIEYRKLSLSLFRGRAQADALKITFDDPYEQIDIDQVVVNEVDRSGEIPAFLNFQISGINLRKDHHILQKYGIHLEGMAYDEISVDLALGYRYDPQKRQLDISELRISADDVGDVQFGALLANIEWSEIIEAIDSGGAALIGLLPSAAITKARIIYHDESMVSRWINLAARNKGVSAAAWRSELLAKIGRRISREKNKGIKAALKQIHAFLLAPGTIEIAATPKKPVTLLRLFFAKDARRIAKLLKIEIKI